LAVQAFDEGLITVNQVTDVDNVIPAKAGIQNDFKALTTLDAGSGPA
jgi:hypothetical protein